MFNEVVEINAITDYNEKKLWSIIKNAIDENSYVLIGWDRYYVKNCINYLSSHLNHNALISGYNENEKTLYVTDYGINGKEWATHEIKFSLVLKAIREGFKIIKELSSPWETVTNRPICCFSLKNTTPEFSLSQMWFECEKYLEGYEYMQFLVEYNRSFVMRGGISIYRGISDLIQELKEDEAYLGKHPFTLSGISNFYNNKKLYINRLEYLNYSGILEYNDNLKNKVILLCENVESVLALLIKFNKTKNKNLLPKCEEWVNKACERDREFMKDLVANIKKEILKKLKL